MVLFGEQLDVEAEMAAQRSVRECDLLLAVGTSGEVSTAADLIRYASDVGALLVTVDPAATVPGIFDVHVQLPAEDAIPACCCSGVRRQQVREHVAHGPARHELAVAHPAGRGLPTGSSR